MNRFANRINKTMQGPQDYEIVRVLIIPKKTDIRQLMREKNREGLVYLRTEPTEILFKKYTK